MSMAVDIRVCANSLSFDPLSRSWHEEQSFTSVGGLTTSQRSRLVPVADGVCAVEVEEPGAWAGADLRVEELHSNLLVLTAVDRRTERPLLVETTTVIDELRRVRTVQRFDHSGALLGVYVIKETRVIDAVTGAVEPVRRS